eukprot:PhM_4_TR8267/c0_g1_i2/m.106509
MSLTHEAALFTVQQICARRRIINVDINVLKPIGSGGNGDVFEAQAVNRYGQEVFGTKVFALKRLPSVNIISLSELCLQSLLPARHAHLVTPMFTWVDEFDGSAYIAMKRATCDVATILREAKCGRRAPPTITEIVSWTRQALDALTFLHSHGVVHRDIKPHNMLLFSSGKNKKLTLKIADFGVGSSIKDQYDDPRKKKGMGLYVGTPCYMAPEVHDMAKTGISALSPAVDIWSLVVEMLTLKRLATFSSSSKGGGLKLSEDELRRCVVDVHPQAEEEWESLFLLCISMLRVDPSERPTAQELMNDMKSIK